mgnify:CR=1 FL=1
MFYYLLYPLKDIFFGFNIFNYISFRGAGAAITALIISFLIGPKIIRTLSFYQVGETIRKTGPESHLKKKGTPTMGGIIVLLAIILPTILWAKLYNKHILLIVMATMWMGAIGFLDDYLKIVKKYSRGLIARYKLTGQITLGLIVGIIVINYPDVTQHATAISIPFVANGTLDVGWFVYLLLSVLVITGTSNAVNITDGLDGLATGLVAIATLVFGAIAYATGRLDYSNYLNIIYLPGTGELFVFCLAMIGASIGFLWFNANPAKVFMGDTGSLAMGAALGTLAVLVKKEILLFLIGGVFVIESLSVILQIYYFKYTKKKYGEGRRILKMAPLHHHCELIGWSEPKVLSRFLIAAVVFACFSLATLKLR